MCSEAFATLPPPAYQLTNGDDQRSYTPPSVPRDNARRLTDITPTILKARQYPGTERVVEHVNEFFLRNWPFRTQEQRRRFVDKGYAWFVCITCPLSIDERIHWGCQLLTTVGLIDDILNHVSVEEGIEHNSKVIACAREAMLPDRSVPAQWLIYDLFRDMRAVDKQLSDGLLECTIDSLLAQAEFTREEAANEGYFLYRDADLGKKLLTALMRFCTGLHMTETELEIVSDIEENAMKHVTFVNDICSFGENILAAKHRMELGAMGSSVPIMMDLRGLDQREATREMWKMVRNLEVRHFELADKILSQRDRPAMRSYLRRLEHQIAGNEIWCLLTPLYGPKDDIAITEQR